MLLSAANIMNYWWQIKISMQHWLNKSDRRGIKLLREPVTVPLCPSHLTCTDLVHTWLNLTSCWLQNLKIPESQSYKHGYTHTHSDTGCMKWQFSPSIPVGQTWRSTEWQQVTTHSPPNSVCLKYIKKNSGSKIWCSLFTKRMSVENKTMKGICLSMADWLQFFHLTFTQRDLNDYSQPLRTSLFSLGI